MPQTAAALAARSGLPYRPDLMAGTDPASRQYQDAITEAAVREAWDYGHKTGNLGNAAMYYFGGSDTGKWGPKTRKYGQDVLARMGAN